MTWVNLNNVYLPQAGGIVTGNLQVNGNLTINDKTGKGTLYNVASEITALRDSVSHYKILWSGASYMASSHTVNLSENISSQNFGIVLAWSGYDSSKNVAYDYDWNYTFIPKYHTLNGLSQNKGVGCLLTEASGDIIARKYIYVHDNYLQGYNNNDAQSAITAFSQIKFQNAYFVLRYVIGV